MEFEAKTMNDRKNKPRCILCGDPIQEGEIYHTMQHKGTKYFHKKCWEKRLEK